MIDVIDLTYITSVQDKGIVTWMFMTNISVNDRLYYRMRRYNDSRISFERNDGKLYVIYRTQLIDEQTVIDSLKSRVSNLVEKYCSNHDIAPYMISKPDSVVAFFLNN